MAMWSKISWAKQATRPFALLLLFFASGAAGLGYQTIWGKMLGVGLGHEMPAVLAVVASVMGGITLGAWLLHYRISQTQFPVQYYVALELIIGLWGLVLSWVLPWLNQWLAPWSGSSPLRHWAVAFVVPFLALLPSTAAMGATFPAMERILAQSWTRCVGATYAANTLGAAAGALGAVCVLAPRLGFRNTLWSLAAVNVACAAAAWLLPRPAERTTTEGTIIRHLELETRHLNHPAEGATTEGEGKGFPAERAPTEKESKGGLPTRHWLWLGLTGLLGIGYEVVGVRVLSQILENTIYTFAIVLAVFLVGTALGAAVYQRWLARLEFHRVMIVGLNCLAIGIAAEIWVMAWSEKWYRSLRDAWPNTPGAVGLAEMTVALAVFALPTFCMGIVFSHLVQAAKQRLHGVGKAVAANTAGGALAGLVFGVLLLPRLGASWTLVVLVGGYLALLPRLTGWQWSLPAVALLLALSAPHSLRFVSHPERLIRWKQGVMATVAVVEDSGGHRSLRVNNRFQMGGTAAAAAEYRQAHLPLLLHPNPHRALFLGVGTGITLGGAVLHPELTLDAVELLPEVVDCLDAFEPFNRGVRHRPDTRIVVADARRYVLSCSTHYDVVVGDLFHPARDGAGVLYAREHYRAIQTLLAKDGVFCQWLPVYQMEEETLRTVVRTFLDVFPNADAWLLRLNVDAPVVGLVAGAGRFTPDWVERRIASEPLAEELSRLALADSLRVFGCWLAGPKALESFAGDAPPHTDDRPRVTFGAPAYTYRADSHPYAGLMRLLDLPDAESSDRFEPGSAEFLAELNKYVRARDVYLHGLAAETEGRTEEAFAAYIDSARISPEFTSGYARCLTAATTWIEARPREARWLIESLIHARPENPVAKQLHQKWFEE